jgi:putative ABC transport system substrate-binding protein
MFNPDINPFSPYVTSFETAARSVKVEPIIARVQSDAEIEAAIIALGREPGGGLVVIGDIFTNLHRAPIILAAAQNNVPAVYGQPYFVRNGGLLSYGTDGQTSFVAQPLMSIAFYAARSHPICRSSSIPYSIAH